MSTSEPLPASYLAELRGGPYDGQVHQVDGVDGTPGSTLALPQPDTEVTADYVLDGDPVRDGDGLLRATYRWLEATFD